MVDDGQTVGLVTVRRVNAVPVDERDRTTLREVACPLAACSDGRALVFADGQLAGIVAAADISQELERISGNRAGWLATSTAPRVRVPS